jgi:hypothetical protein
MHCYHYRMATTRKPIRPDPFDFETLLMIDKRIDSAEVEGIRDRWEFGRLMLEARGGKKRLPNGYLAELVTRTGKSQSELSYRVKFAEAYPTEAELSNALESYSSWHELVDNLYAKLPHSDDVFVVRTVAAFKRLSRQPDSWIKDAKIVGLHFRWKHHLALRAAAEGESVELIADVLGISVEEVKGYLETPEPCSDEEYFAEIDTWGES